MRFPRLSRVVVAIVVALIASLVAVGATTTSASAAETGKVRGAIYAGKGLADRIQVTWFDSDWHYIGKRKLSRGVYSLRLRTGTYWLQFTDLRPVYDVTRYAPTNVKVTVRSGRTATKTVHMHRGAAITGVVKAGGKPAGGARIVAANTSEQSFSVNANSKGQFAVGGLPAGSYSVFSYDRAKKWVGKSLWVPGMKLGQQKNVTAAMNVRAGTLLVDFYNGNGDSLGGKAFVTAVSRSSGQFWTAKMSGGSATFAGLYPGKYKLVVPDVGAWFGRTGAVTGKVRSGRPAFGSFRLTKHGAWISGTVVDASAQGRVLGGAVVQAWSSAGTKLGEATSDDDGLFSITGPIHTQSDVTLVVQPGPYSDYLGDEPLRCQYVRTPHPGYSVLEDEDNFVDLLTINRLSPQTKQGCEARADRSGAQPKRMSASPQ
ncbi:MAG: carboxypeptidase regulatory-like domain-containing protein [Nocardioides sp.]|nr:carboxypeptidase regulatory-like domain-containing protein [Nocardioidaceae bacterium]MCB8955125.1 carboxypeptidase regulatory-like domain-containing protein [Nocardioides sp.]